MAAHRQNPADKLREYSITELEQIAEKFHDGIGDRFEIPVDVDLLLEDIDGVDLDIWPGLQANYRMLGMTGFNRHTGILSIYIDDQLADSSAGIRRYRMTVAEELAHIIIHRPAIEAVEKPEDFRHIQNHDRWYLYERNAKWLAAAILMPASHVLRDAGKMYTEMISALPADMKYTNPEAIKKMITSKLAAMYDVSVVSMHYRLEKWPINVISKIDEAMKNQFDFLE
ncbi:MAG: ImmA/IrrE family metallo-endopeptidase [Planctomycetes bacterium]|nr:ImmA/IrrE family metallo-endopeptidase [Planctomycetota bacterium]